jgi:hypothetical protein
MNSTSVLLNENTIIPTMADSIPPVRQPKVVQYQANAQVLSDALDQERIDKNQLQNRLEGQVQEGEVALFQAVQRIKRLTQELGQVRSEEDKERNRATSLEGQLASEIRLKTDLQTLCHQFQNQQYVLQDERDNAVKIRDDIERLLLASNTRIVVLEQQIASERSVARGDKYLGFLQLNKALCQADLENVYHARSLSGVATVFTGIILGPVAGIGLIGGALLGVGLGFAISPFTSNPEEASISRRLQDYTKEIDDITKNRLKADSE